MANPLVEAMRKARRRDVPVGRFTFIIEVPPERKLMALMPSKRPDEPLSDKELADMNSSLARECVIGWKGVREVDLVPSGVEDEIPFNLDVFQEWIDSRADMWAPLASAVLSRQSEIVAARNADEKNSPSA